MATLFNTKISATYEGLFKTIDNAAITASLKELTDGSGNQSGLYVNNAGDFKVSNILEWGSLKDTGTGVTITRYVTSTDGIENFDNNTSLPTSAAVKLYVDSKFATSDTLQEVLSFGNTTGGNDIVVSASDDITFTDSSKILMGAGSDLQIYHDSSNISYIKHNTSSDFRIQTSSTGYIKLMAELENMAVFIPNSAVELYFDNSKKLATTNTGVDVTGNLVVSGSITGAGGSFLPLAGGAMTGNTTHLDNVRSLYGTSSDLQIYHDSSNSYIRDVGTGRLWIDSNGEGVSIISDGSGSSPMAHFYKDAAVELYYDNSKKFETTVGGASITGALDVTGVITADGGLNLNDNDKIKLGTSGDLEIYHDGSNSYIKDTGSGGLRIATNQFRVYNAAVDNLIINAIENGAVELYYNDSKKIETVTAGAKVTGNLEVTGTITGSGGSFLPLAGGTMTGDTIHNDNVKSIYGTSSDGLEITHDGSNSLVSDTGTGGLFLQANSEMRFRKNGTSEIMAQFLADAEVRLYYNNSKKFETTNTGIAVTGNGAFSGNVSVPDTNFLIAGTGGDVIIGHDGSNSTFRNSTGDLNIEQFAVTKSIIFKVSDANAGDVTALTISRNGDLTTGRDVTIAGDLTVNGTTTTINTQTLAVEDPLIELAKDNAANSVDIGFYGKYNDGTARYLGLFSDASDSNKFRLFKGTTVQPTTTVDIGGAGYVAADLQVAGLEATTIATSGTVSVGNTLYVTEYIQHLGDTNNNIRFQAGRMILQSKASASAKIDLHDNGSLFLNSGGGTALTLDTSQNATFAGDVITTGTSFIGKASTSSYLPDDGVFGGIITNGGGFKITTQAVDTLTLSAVGGNMTVRGGGTFGGDVTTGQSLLVNGVGNNSSLTLGANTGNWVFTNVQSSRNLEISDSDGTGTVMTINTSGNVGIGTDSPTSYYSGADNLVIKKDSGEGGMSIVTANDTSGALYFADGTSGNEQYRGGIGYTHLTDKLFLVSGGQTRVWMNDSGNVGIGTDSPDAKLVVRTSTDHNFEVEETGGELRLSALNDARSANIGLQFAASEFNFITGNVGIGTDSPNFDLTLNSATGAQLQWQYNSASHLRIEADSGGGSYYAAAGFYHRFFTSGAERMRIDSSGNVQLQTVGAQLRFQNSAGAAPYIKNSGEDASTAPYGQNLEFYTGGSKRLTIDSSGNSTFAGSIFLDGFTNPNTRYISLRQSFVPSAPGGIGLMAKDHSGSSNDGLALYGHDGVSIYTAQAERMKITSGGDVELKPSTSRIKGGGTTSGKLELLNSDSTSYIVVNGSANAAAHEIAFVTNSALRFTIEANGQGYFQAGLRVGGLYITALQGNAQLTNASTSSGSNPSYIGQGLISVTISDAKAKENFEDVKENECLNQVQSLAKYVKKFDWIDEDWKKEKGRTIGMVAQEVNEEFPELVHSPENYEDEGWAIRYQEIVPTLIKSIQELKAEVDKLKQECKCKN